MAPKSNLVAKVDRLRKQVNDLRYRYHVKNDPTVTDKMYEGLMGELREMEEKYPNLRSLDSPTQRVAGKPLTRFKKIKHSVSQWSFNDAFNTKQLLEWEERNIKYLEKKLGNRPDDISYIAELKIDGLHMVLTYKDGLLQSGATRGDGKIGEDVTQNIKTIQSVPLRLKKKINLVAEGEVWMSGKMLKTINEQRAKNNEPLYANPRNVAAGTIRQLDSKIVAKRNLQLTAYDISGGKIPDSQKEELVELKKLGFLTDKHWKVCRNTDEVIRFWRLWENNKHSNEYWVDGVVVKVNQKKYQNILGFTGKAPRWALALKFASEQGTTKIKDIFVQVGRTGALTPVALMEPIRLGGTTVTHATLHNFDEIKRLDVRVGDTVIVEKAGEIIPKVVRVLEKMRSGNEKKVKEIKKCPKCGASVDRRNIGERGKDKGERGSDTSAALYCVNPHCYAQQIMGIKHFVSKKAFNIDGFGVKIVEQLAENGLIKDVADIFTLRQGDLEVMERFGEKSAKNLISSIDKSKVVSLPRFIFGLGINQVGEETAIHLTDHFGTLKNIMQATTDELEAVSDVGPSVAKAIRTYFSNNKNQKLISNLIRNGVLIKKTRKQNKKKTNLSGKILVITGTLESISRDKANDLIRGAGGSVSGSVSKKTDYLVTGENPGSKLKIAKSLGIPVINETKLKELLK
jgi:DNA ligase (NAD+)